MTTTISGTSGIVTPAANIAAGVGGTPAFNAYRTSVQAVTSGVWTKVQLNVEEFDTANVFDSATNYRFQPTTAGYYQINGAISGTATGTTLVVSAIYKNGAGSKQGSWVSSTNGGVSTCGGLVYLNGSTDYVELWGYVSGAPTSIGGVIDVTFMSGFLARAA